MLWRMGRAQGAGAIFALLLCCAIAGAQPASPRHDVAAAQAAMAAQDYEQALKLYAHALHFDEKNPSLWVAFGDAQNALTARERDRMPLARDSWERALTID